MFATNMFVRSSDAISFCIFNAINELKAIRANKEFKESMENVKKLASKQIRSINE